MGVHVAFDIGNVLCHFDIMIFVKKLAEIANINDHDAYFFLDHLQRMQDIGVTNVAHGLEYKFKLTSEELNILLETWNKTLLPNEMMLNFLDNLRADGVRIALLSNMGPEHIAYLRSTCPRLFEKTVQHISCEVGARKPQKLFFQSFGLDNDDFLYSKEHLKPGSIQHALETPVDFSGCIYVDDLEDNLKIGKRYGFKVYQFNLNEMTKLTQSKQKIELDKLKRAIYDKC